MALSLVATLLLLASMGVGVAVAAFSATTSNGPNSFSAAADWTACTASTTVVAKAVAYVPGYIKQGSLYYVYASVADTGNPASGVATVSANVSAIDSLGAVALALTSGSYSVGGVSYNYRSAVRLAMSPLAAGSYTYSITCTDAAGNSGTQGGFTVTADNTAPAASSVAATNKAGGILRRAEQGDTIMYVYSEQIDPESVLTGWTGASTNVVVRLNHAGGGGRDTVLIYDATNVTLLNLGTISLPDNSYSTANTTFGATGTPSTMVQSGATITINLGTQSIAAATGNAGTSRWTPSASAYDRAGNASSTTAVTTAASMF